MDINFINKASWYENLLSVIKDVDYIYESRKKRFKAEVKVYYEDGSFCSFPSEIRISGDHQDHIRKTNLAASLDVHLKNGNIGNIVKFKLFLPETRNNDIELVAFHGETTKGNIKMVASESISGEAKKILLSSKNNTKIMSSGITECIGNSCLKIYGSIISGISDAVAVKDSKVGGQRYQTQQNQA